jgi:hypothetical protein
LVTFFIDGQPRPPVFVGLTGGWYRASLLATDLTAGGHTVTAVYSGDATNAPSQSSPVQVTIVAARTTTELRSSTRTSVYGQLVTFTATVAIANLATVVPPPTGMVAFRDGRVVIGTVPLVNGVATLNWISTGVGKRHSITATYRGDPNAQVSTSRGLAQVVQKARTIVVMDAVPSHPYYTDSQFITFVIRVITWSRSGAEATGSVVLTGGRNRWSMRLDGHTARLVLPTSKVLRNTFTTRYPGNSNFAASSARLRFGRTAPAWPMSSTS